MVFRAFASSIPLRGAGGEPVDFRATLHSHGLGRLAPNAVDEDGRVFETTLALGERQARTVRVVEDPPGALALEVAGSVPGHAAQAALRAAVRTIFSLDDPPRLIVDVGVREARREAQVSALRSGEGELGAHGPIPC